MSRETAGITILILIMGLATGCGSPRPAPPPAEEPAISGDEDAGGVRIEGGRVVNQDAAYSFDLPQGWSMSDDVSETRMVVIEKDGSDAAFAVFVKPATADLDGELEQLRATLVDSPSQYEVLEVSRRTIDGLPAASLLTAHVMNEGPRLTQNYVLVRGDVTYVLGCEMADDEAGEIAPIVERIVASFRLAPVG